MRTLPKPLNILIPDGESYVCLGVLQCLSDIRGLRIFLLSERKTTSMRFSRYVDTYLYQPKIHSIADWVGTINQLTIDHSIDVIMPVDEHAARKLIQSRAQLHDPDKLLLPDSLDLFDLSRDKGRLARHLEQLGIPGPKTVPFEREAADKAPLVQLSFPLLLKPTLESGGGKGILKFDSEKALKSYLEKNEPEPKLLLQEYIEGYDLGCNVLCRDGEILAFTIQKGFLFEKKSFTPQIGLQMIYQQEVYEMVKTLMKSLNWSGVANIDMRFDERENLFRILEINPRFWLTVLGSSMGGVNFPFLYCQAVMGHELQFAGYRESRFLNFKGFYTQVLNQPSYAFKLKEIWKTTPLRYMLKDPFLNLYHVLWSFKNIVSRKVGRVFPRIGRQAKP